MSCLAHFDLKFEFSIGLWSASLYSGMFLGPTFAGILVDKYGFRSSTVVFLLFYCIGLALDLLELIKLSNMKKNVDYKLT